MKQIILHDDSFEIEIDVLDSLTTSLPVTVHYYESLSDNVAEKLLLFHLTQGSNTIISGSPNHPIVITEITVYNPNDSGKDIILKITDGVDSFAILKEKIKAKETFYLSCCKGVGGGGAGQDGIGLDYDWNGTELGIKREDEDNYDYTDLKGEKGDTGEDGNEVALRINSGYIQWRIDDGVDAWKNLIALSALKGADGQDGRKVELQADSGYIQWKYDNVPTWTNLIAISALKGEKGDDGDSVELQIDSGYIQWRVADGVDIWKNLLAVSTLKGDAGDNIELNVSGGYIRWRVADGVDTWKNLIATSALKGEKGDEIELQKSATHIQWKYASSGSWTNLVALSDLKGADGANGADGKEVSLQKSATHIQWRLGTGAWQNLVALADLKGEKGDKGEKGEKGDTGNDGATVSVGDNFPSEANSSIGDLYIRTPQYDLYKKVAAGTWHIVGNIKGAKGDKGDNGTDGTEISTGSSSPSGGNDGDLYIHTGTYDLYKKVSGTWIVIGNIKGGSGGGGSGSLQDAWDNGKEIDTGVNNQTGGVSGTAIYEFSDEYGTFGAKAFIGKFVINARGGGNGSAYQTNEHATKGDAKKMLQYGSAALNIANEYNVIWRNNSPSPYAGGGETGGNFIGIRHEIKHQGAGFGGAVDSNYMVRIRGKSRVDNELMIGGDNSGFRLSGGKLQYKNEAGNWQDIDTGGKSTFAVNCAGLPDENANNGYNYSFGGSEPTPVGFAMPVRAFLKTIAFQSATQEDAFITLEVNGVPIETWDMASSDQKIVQLNLEINSGRTVNFKTTKNGQGRPLTIVAYFEEEI